MAKQNAVYEPGELDRVRGKLGSLDPNEAKRMAQVLGGKVGVEKSETPPPPRPRTRTETVDVHVKGKSGSGGGNRSQPRRRPESPLPVDSEDEESLLRTVPKKPNPADDPTKPYRLSYWERTKMDRMAGSAEFDIKNPIQVLQSILSFFSRPADLVSSSFVKGRMNEYYKHIETLVTATRSLLPRNNVLRNERMKRISYPAYLILDLIRQWNIEKIASDLSRIQANPRSARVEDFQEILKIIYRPMFLMEQLDLENHIKEAYRLVYKILFIENPTEAQNKQQELLRNAVAAFGVIRRDIRFLLYPLLLKLLSDKFLTYNAFFTERRNRFITFIEATEADRLSPQSLLKDSEVTEEMVIGKKEGEEEENAADESIDESDLNDAEKKKRVVLEAERKALDRGLDTLETLFPKAGWDQISEFPDLFPYFSELLDLKKGYILIPATDPLQQVAVLTRILEELLFGLRYVNFTTVDQDGNPEDISEAMTSIMTNWHFYIDDAFGKEYLPRLDEYCHILDNPAESRSSPYAKRLLNEIHWIKRLYFLPYYRFEASSPPPFQKKEVTALYPEIRHLRKYLTAVAAGIEQGIKVGSPKENTRCDGIGNPWEPYIFQVPNPVSKRLDSLLGKKQTNASLIFYTLAVTVVLDNLVNDERSWAYNVDWTASFFRSVNNAGVTPVFGIDEKVDTEAIFKQSLKQKEEG
ncbi:hypothetical protein TREPR_0508 [Treponema primitia ZAS-2]|uniref:Uncharacterized protein n=1 Tax=Treponema primitia (strain ATCC BAA-887 / DSM 12427 / ZAS-2) TaxID=545694 RepID=F5YLD2_TREPZ|nr:hypothetical protein [Treponema primitia]AEF85724.1 hypothetical protein TREPR_0508 [Treponema primitia ZAS-2]